MHMEGENKNVEELTPSSSEISTSEEDPEAGFALAKSRPSIGLGRKKLADHAVESFVATFWHRLQLRSDENDPEYRDTYRTVIRKRKSLQKFTSGNVTDHC